MSFTKCRPFCFGLNDLTTLPRLFHTTEPRVVFLASSKQFTAGLASYSTPIVASTLRVWRRGYLWDVNFRFGLDPRGTDCCREAWDTVGRVYVDLPCMELHANHVGCVC